MAPIRFYTVNARTAGRALEAAESKARELKIGLMLCSATRTSAFVMVQGAEPLLNAWEKYFLAKSMLVERDPAETQPALATV